MFRALRRVCSSRRTLGMKQPSQLLPPMHDRPIGSGQVKMSPIVQQTRLERVWLALMPSPTEALGLVVLEYLWGEIPCLTSADTAA